MPVVLQITSGPSKGRKIHVARGQIAKFGRTEWADFSFPSDSSMADIHFSIDADGPECLIKDCSGEIGTRVNGEPVSEARIHTGDIITAGQSTFSVAVEGEAAPVRQQNVADAAPPPVGESPVPIAADYCQKLSMSDPAKELLATGMTPADFLELMIANELYADALRFLAFWLPGPVAVGWGCDCVELVYSGKLIPSNQKALDAARAWSKEPNESNCRAAEVAAIETGHSGPSSWLALGAFWSGNSLAPADLPPVTPPEGLTAEAITGALILAATQGNPQQAIDRYQAFLKNGQALIRETEFSYNFSAD